MEFLKDQEWDIIFGDTFMNPTIKAEQIPLTSPVFEEDQTQQRFFDLDSNAAILPQTYTSDEADMMLYSMKGTGHSTLDIFNVIPWEDHFGNKSSMSSSQQQVFNTTEGSTCQNEPETNASAFPVEYLNMDTFPIYDQTMEPFPTDNLSMTIFNEGYDDQHPPVEKFCPSAMGYEPVQNPYPVQLTSVVESHPQQQVSQKPISDSNDIVNPIQMQVLECINPDDKLESSKKPSKSKNRMSIGPYYCESCDRRFKSSRGLKQHCKIYHSAAMLHRCEICGKRFQDYNLMYQHHKRHLLKDKPYKCDKCPKQFMFLTDLNRHHDKHHGNGRFACLYCEKMYVREDHLDLHEMSHRRRLEKIKARKLRKTGKTTA